eukprot:2642988-Ditylum_brightwellii.AAC.1
MMICLDTAVPVVDSCYDQSAHCLLCGEAPCVVKASKWECHGVTFWCAPGDSNLPVLSWVVGGWFWFGMEHCVNVNGGIDAWRYMQLVGSKSTCFLSPSVFPGCNHVLPVETKFVSLHVTCKLN